MQSLYISNNVLLQYRILMPNRCFINSEVSFFRTHRPCVNFQKSGQSFRCTSRNNNKLSHLRKRGPKGACCKKSQETSERQKHPMVFWYEHLIVVDNGRCENVLLKTALVSQDFKNQKSMCVETWDRFYNHKSCAFV